MESAAYHRKRDYYILGKVGVCATKREDFIEEVFALPTAPVSATIDLIGVPAVISAMSSPEIAQMYESATYAAMDGMQIVKMARRRGFDCDRCAAPDIMKLIFAESVKRGKSHYFYGGKDDEVLKKLRENLEEEFPGIDIKGMHSPPFRPLTDEEDEAICTEINSLKPDFLWVGIGAPKQEMWMWRHEEKIRGTVMLGVGAGFNFLAGTLAKAPTWMENAGIEWIYRLIKEPKRLWKRYIIGGARWVGYNISYKLGGGK